MGKWLCWGSLGVASLLSLVFLLDYVMNMVNSSFKPFAGVSPTVDLICVLAGGMLIYLSWDAIRDTRR